MIIESQSHIEIRRRPFQTEDDLRHERRADRQRSVQRFSVISKQLQSPDDWSALSRSSGGCA
jgi:hypothetical protein